MRWHLHERDVVIEAADVTQLHEEQKQRGGVLEARHDRLRRKLDQRAELDQAEQRLQHASEENDGKRNRQDQRNAAGSDLWRIGTNQAVDQNAKKEGAVDPRRVDGRRPIAEHHAEDCDNECGREPGKRTVGEIAFAERRECEHPVTHREWNGDGSGYKAANEIG